MSVVLSDLAQADFNSILDYTLGRWGERQVTKYNQLIQEGLFTELKEQCNSANPTLKYGGIFSMNELLENMKQNCIPTSIFDMKIEQYNDFIKERRILIARKIRAYYETI